MNELPFIGLVGVSAEDVFFLIAALAALIVMAIFARRFIREEQFAARARLLQERRTQLKAQLSAPVRRKKDTSSAISLSFMRAVVNKLNLLQVSQAAEINRLLTHAGYRSKDAAFVFSFFQLICPIVMVAIGLLVTKINFSDPFAVKWKWLWIVGMAYLGAKLPGILVANARHKRYEAIQKSLSDTLDLLTVCAEAGLSLAAALDRVARELAHTYPEMAEELTITSIELGLLPDRKKALTNLAERVNIQEIRGVVGVLVQTEKYGTPVAQSLRMLAAEFRTQRMLRAEQKAARLPAIMTVPMIVFILPTLFIIVLTPAILSVLDKLHR